MTRKRSNKKIKKMALTARDVMIILSVYENRFLRRDQIQRLHFPDASFVACCVRLKKLYENHFLDRVLKPVTKGSAQAAYALDKRGADVVAAAREIDRHKVRWSRAHNRVEFLFLEHTLGISEFKVCLDLALAGKREELFFYERGDRSHLRRISVPDSKKKHLVVSPDAFIEVQVPKGRYAFFLEIDLGTETLFRFAEKITAFKQYWKSGEYQQDYGLKFFRVLTVAESERRLTNLLQVTGKAGGRRMFLFTTFARIHEVGILEPIWFSPADTEPISILD